VLANSHHHGNQVGFVKVNKATVWESSAPNSRGVTIVLVDPIRCSVEEWRTFDTYATGMNAIKLSIYLGWEVSDGSIIVGVTADEPRHNLMSALHRLRLFGVDVYDVKFHGAFAFVTQKGFPSKTVMRKTNGPDIRPYVAVSIAGKVVETLFLSLYLNFCAWCFNLPIDVESVVTYDYA